MHKISGTANTMHMRCREAAPSCVGCCQVLERLDNAHTYPSNARLEKSLSLQSAWVCTASLYLQHGSGWATEQAEWSINVSDLLCLQPGTARHMLTICHYVEKRGSKYTASISQLCHAQTKQGRLSMPHVVSLCVTQKSFLLCMSFDFDA